MPRGDAGRIIEKLFKRKSLSHIEATEFNVEYLKYGNVASSFVF